MLPKDRIRALLLEHDDPRHLERPADFDRETSRNCFARLVSALEERFGPSCSSGLGQDASFYGVITVPADATGLGRPLWVLMSNFGSYFVTAEVVVGVGAPSEEACPPEEFVTWLDGVCTAMGCTFVPTELLRELYDGPSVLAAAEDVELAAVLIAAGEAEAEEDDDELGKSDWSERYFEYM
ncbi:hypothetical protein [Streptomyces yerevanensis]|uniref:hypothetical protein n=1 Tax=Streptomyces yerevanensis TaxID=66378 RepID=UPI000689580E|nr:hypothetical protein [Streptomyces yerevanensis]